MPEKIGRRSGKKRGAWFEWAAMDKLYAHDDRHGPYLRVQFPDAIFFKKHILPNESKESANIVITWDYKEDAVELARVLSLIIPVYPKLRLKYQFIERVSLDKLGILNDKILTNPHQENKAFPREETLPLFETLNLKYYFARGTDYLPKIQNQLSQIGIDPKEIYNLSKLIRLPKYVGVCQVDRIDIIEDTGKGCKIARRLTPFLDILFDTTESHLGNCIRAVIVKDWRLYYFTKSIFKIFQSNVFPEPPLNVTP